MSLFVVNRARILSESAAKILSRENFSLKENLFVAELLSALPLASIKMDAPTQEPPKNDLLSSGLSGRSRIKTPLRLSAFRVATIIFIAIPREQALRGPRGRAGNDKAREEENFFMDFSILVFARRLRSILDTQRRFSCLASMSPRYRGLSG